MTFADFGGFGFLSSPPLHQYPHAPSFIFRENIKVVLLLWVGYSIFYMICTLNFFIVGLIMKTFSDKKIILCVFLQLFWAIFLSNFEKNVSFYSLILFYLYDFFFFFEVSEIALI